MYLSFIILTHNSEKFLQRCLESITRSADEYAQRYEIRIFDNGSKDGTVELLQQAVQNSEVEIIIQAEQTNIGTTVSRNRMLRDARGEFLCIMDSDVEITREALKRLIDALECEPDTGIAVPMVLFPDGRWQKSFDRFPTLFDKVNRAFNLRRLESREAPRLLKQSTPFAVDYAISACWMISRRIIDIVGFLDERIFYAPEDVDYCLRVWKCGYRVVYVPSVHVIHHTQESSRGFNLRAEKWHHVRGLAYFFFKHHYLLRRPRFKYAPPAT